MLDIPSLSASIAKIGMMEMDIWSCLKTFDWAKYISQCKIKQKVEALDWIKEDLDLNTSTKHTAIWTSENFQSLVMLATYFQYYFWGHPDAYLQK
jgi:hypothetical protein